MKAALIMIVIGLIMIFGSLIWAAGQSQGNIMVAVCFVAVGGVVFFTGLYKLQESD